MTGRFEAWLAGGTSGTNTAQEPANGDEADAHHPGQRYGLPATGAGSVGSLWRRLVAFVVDCVLAAVITSVFAHRDFALHDQAANSWSLLTWFLITVVGVAFFAATPGMVLFGLRVARVDGASYVFPLRAAVRAILVMLVVPAVIWDADRRGLHDRAAGTIVVTIR